MTLAANLKAPEARTFAGNFVTLLPLETEKDAEELFHISHRSSTSTDLWRYLPLGPFDGLGPFKDFLHMLQSQKDTIPFTARHPATGACLGTLSLMSIRPEHGVAELGWIWYAPEAQRTKVNTETSYLLLRYAFEELHYRRMEWKCNSLNERSHRAALRLGFSYEGTFRQHMIVKGENRNTDWFSMLDHEWPHIGSALSHWLYKDDSVSLHELTAKALPISEEKN